jgi:hypothetical protein
MTQQFGRVCRWQGCLACARRRLCEFVHIGPKPRSDTRLSVSLAFSLNQTCAPSLTFYLLSQCLQSINQPDSAGPSPSTDKFTAIFNPASTEYALRKGHRKTSRHTLLPSRSTPAIVQKTSQTYLVRKRKLSANFAKGDEKLMAVLDPAVLYLVHICCDARRRGWSCESPHFIWYGNSPTSCSQPFSPAKTIFTGITVLLGVRPPWYAWQ